jgi:hypothetical protein
MKKVGADAYKQKLYDFRLRKNGYTENYIYLFNVLA